MLQAITLENSPTLLKGQTGNKCASDPPDAFFAGVMAQTRLTASTSQARATIPASRFSDGNRTRSADPSPSRAGTPEGSAKAKSAEPKSSSEEPQSSPEVASPGVASGERSEEQQAPTGPDRQDDEEPSSGTVTGQQAPLQPQILAGLVQAATPPQESQPVIQDQGTPSGSGEPILAAVPLATGSIPSGNLPVDDPGLPGQQQAREATRVPADPLSLVDPSVASVPPQDSSTTAGQEAAAPEGLANDPPADSPETPRTGAPPADPSPAGTIPREISQTFVLDSPEASSGDTPSSEPIRHGQPGKDGTTSPLPNRSTPANPSSAAAVDPALRATSLDLKTAPADEVAGNPAALPGPAGNPDPASPKNTKSSAANRLPSGMDAGTPRAGNAEAPESSGTLSGPSDAGPASKPAQDKEKDLLPTTSTAREETAGAAIGKDSVPVQKAHLSPAEAFAQPLGADLKAESGTFRAENLATARSNPVFTQVEGSIRWIIQNKSQEAELQLHPDSLGRVTVQLKVEGQEVHAHLWASEASSLPILQEHKASLEASLKEQGLNLGSFNLHFGARHEQSQTAPQTWNMSHASKSFLSAEGKQEIPSRSADPGLLSSMDPHQIEVYA